VTKSKGTVKLLLVVLAASCFNSCTSSNRSATENNKVKVFGVFASPKDEQFSGVIDDALRSAADAGKIEYSFIDRIGYDGEFDAVLSHICQKEDAAIVIGDGFGNEESIRRSAANCPNKVFAFSQDGLSIDPNLLVFENRINENSYLAGMVAGGSTKTNIIGVVGARPLAQANRMANAFIAGARFVNPNVTVKVSFNGSYFDKSLAEDAALSQIESGVDVIYALCLGVTDAVGDTEVKIISNLGAQIENQSKYVLASVVWNVAPTIDYLIDLVANDSFSLSDIKSFSLSTDSGASITRLDTKIITPDLAKKIADQLTAIQIGALKLETSDKQPADSVSP
jgi:basic membrane protein A and related proteins